MAVVGDCGQGKWAQGEYLVRSDAVWILRDYRSNGWKLVPLTPPLRGPVLDYRPIGAGALWIATVPILALCWCLGYAAVRGSSRHSFGTFLSATCILLAAALAALWWRSYRATDELMLAGRWTHHELAAHRGGIQYTVLHDWELTQPQRDDDWMSLRGLLVGHFGCDTADCWLISSLPATSRWEHLGLGFARGDVSGPFGRMHAYRVLRMPMWLPLVVLLLVPSRHLLYAYRRRRRRLRVVHRLRI